MKSMIVGSASGTFVHRSENLRNEPAHWVDSARISAPRYVSGRLRRRPTTAAENAVMTSSVSVVVDMSAVSGASRMPASAASEHPRAHATLESSVDRAPPRAASSRLSTTARIATPMRVRNSRMRRPMASATATTMVMNRCHVSRTSPMWKPRPAKSAGIVCASCWFQIMFARPINANMRPTVTMSWTTSCLPCRCRMIVRSSSDPEQRGEHEHAQRERDRLGNTALDRELPVDVREEHADRALGEVEHPRRRVDDDEATCRHGDDARHRKGDDDPVREARPVDRITGPRRLAHEDDERDRPRPHQQVRPPLRQPRAPSRRLRRARVSRDIPPPGRS